VFSCSLGAGGLPTKKRETICRLPWRYSFLWRTLKWPCCCDCPEQSIGIYSLEPTEYSCTCFRAALLCSCGRKLWVLYCAHKPSGRLWRAVPYVASKFPPRIFTARMCRRKIMSPSCVPDFLINYRAVCSGPRASWSTERTTTDGRKWTSTDQRTIHWMPTMTR
jgi:hypothetical protein